MFVHSLNSSLVPQDWRDSNLTPLFKKLDRTSKLNYRPVALTSQVCKLMERLILDALWKHIEQNDLLTCHQHGFRKGCSCVTQLLECLNNWTSNFDEGYATDILYLDFQKAFDTVPHKRLLYKLEKMGIKGRVLKWIKSWLTGRRQRVVLPGGVSKWVEVTSGVPQGSILGPLLFLLFINDMPNKMKAMLKLFADDSKSYKKITCKDDCEILQSDLNELMAWAETWQMDFNESKCVHMRMGNKVEPRYRYTLKSHVMEKCTSQKDLGVTVRNDFSPSDHIANIIKSAYGKIGTIKRCFTNLTKKKVQTLYTTIIRAGLEYASTVWNTKEQQHIKSLEKVQRRCLRLTYDQPILQTLEERRHITDMVDTFKYVHQIYKPKAELLFKMDKRGVALRGHKSRMMKIRSRTAVRQQFLTNRVVNCWNNLPDEVVSAPSVNELKKFFQNKEGPN